MCGAAIIMEPWTIFACHPGANDTSVLNQTNAQNQTGSSCASMGNFLHVLINSRKRASAPLKSTHRTYTSERTHTHIASSHTLSHSLLLAWRLVLASTAHAVRQLKGLGLVLVSCVCMGFYYNMQKMVLRHYRPITTTAYRSQTIASPVGLLKRKNLHLTSTTQLLFWSADHGLGWVLPLGARFVSRRFRTSPLLCQLRISCLVPITHTHTITRTLSHRLTELFSNLA